MVVSTKNIKQQNCFQHWQW